MHLPVFQMPLVIVASLATCLTKFDWPHGNSDTLSGRFYQTSVVSLKLGSHVVQA